MKRSPTTTARPKPSPKPAVLRQGTPDRPGGAKRRPGSAPPPVIAPLAAAPTERMSVAAQQRAHAEALFSQIAPKLSAASVVEAEAAPSHRGGAPQFHQSEFQMRLSRQDQLMTAVRNARLPKDAKKAAHELLEDFGRLPPDQALLARVLTFKDERLTEAALDELLELDGKGKVRANPELVEVVRATRTKSPGVRELRDLLLEKLGTAR